MEKRTSSPGSSVMRRSIGRNSLTNGNKLLFPSSPVVTLREQASENYTPPPPPPPPQTSNSNNNSVEKDRPSLLPARSSRRSPSNTQDASPTRSTIDVEDYLALTKDKIDLEAELTRKEMRIAFLENLVQRYQETAEEDPSNGEESRRPMQLMRDLDQKGREIEALSNDLSAVQERNSQLEKAKESLERKLAVDRKAERDQGNHQLLQMLASKEKAVHELMDEVKQLKETNSSLQHGEEYDEVEEEVSRNKVMHMLLGKEKLIGELSHDLQMQLEKNVQLVRAMDALKSDYTQLESELFKARDEAIAMESRTTFSSCSIHQHPSVASEYELLDSIIGDLTFGGEGEGMIAKSLSLDSHSPFENLSSGVTSTQSAETDVGEVHAQLEREMERVSELTEKLQQYEEELQQSAALIMSREKDISTLISTQQSILHDHANLRTDFVEMKKEKMVLQGRVTDLEAEIRRLQERLLGLKDDLHSSQLSELRIGRISSEDLCSFGLKASELEDDGELEEEERAEEGFNYAGLKFLEFTEPLFQQLILVRSIIVLLCISKLINLIGIYCYETKDEGSEDRTTETAKN